MPGEQAEHDLIRVLDNQADSKQDTFFIAPKEIGRDGAGTQQLTLASVTEPDSPPAGEQYVFVDSTGTLTAKFADGTTQALDPATAIANTDISTLQNSDTKADLTQPGGVLVTSQLPAISITSIDVVADQTARLNLTAEEGDVAVQTDTGEAYILSTNDPTVDSNWVEITIDVLSQIAGQQITPAQVGTSSNQATIVADSVTESGNNVVTSPSADRDIFVIAAGASDPAAADADDIILEKQ
jgi:hypothetical protein